MTVDLTTNLELSKPDSSEIGRLWGHSDQLHKVNNEILDSALRDPALLTYTPNFTAITSNPDLGTSDTILEGQYRFLPNKWVMGWILLKFGPGLNEGEDDWYLSLPVAASLTDHAASTISGSGSIIGEVYLRNASFSETSQTALAQLADNSKFMMLTEGGNSSRFLESGVPFIWEDGDRISCNFMYRAAV